MKNFLNIDPDSFEKSVNTFKTANEKSKTNNNVNIRNTELDTGNYFNDISNSHWDVLSTRPLR